MRVWFRWFSSSTGARILRWTRRKSSGNFSSSPPWKSAKFSSTYPKFRSPGFFWLWPVCLFGGFKWPLQGLLCWWPAFGWWKGLLENADKFFFFEFPSCWRMDFYLNHWHTDRSWLKERYVWKTFSSASQVEREVMEMVSRCFSSGGSKKPTASFRDPAP